MSPCKFSVYLYPLNPVSVSPTGGDDGVRTHDPLLAGQVLSQLSYTPVSGFVPLFKDLSMILKN